MVSLSLAETFPPTVEIGINFTEVVVVELHITHQIVFEDWLSPFRLAD